MYTVAADAIFGSTIHCVIWSVEGFAIFHVYWQSYQRLRYDLELTPYPLNHSLHRLYHLPLQWAHEHYTQKHPSVGTQLPPPAPQFSILCVYPKQMIRWPVLCFTAATKYFLRCSCLVWLSWLIGLWIMLVGKTFIAAIAAVGSGLSATSCVVIVAFLKMMRLQLVVWSLLSFCYRNLWMASKRDLVSADCFCCRHWHLDCTSGDRAAGETDDRCQLVVAIHLFSIESP